jgi:hypothetical protein
MGGQDEHGGCVGLQGVLGIEKGNVTARGDGRCGVAAVQGDIRVVAGGVFQDIVAAFQSRRGIGAGAQMAGPVASENMAQGVLFLKDLGAGDIQVVLAGAGEADDLVGGAGRPAFL